MTPDESRTLSIDLDHTLCVSEPSAYAEAVPMPGALEAMQELRRDGWLIVINTARHFNHWRVTTEWLSRHGFEYDQIAFGKPPARYYIDDRAIPFERNWPELCRRLRQARTQP